MQCLFSCRKSSNQSYSKPLADRRRPWKRIHIDFAGPFKGRMFLIVVYSFTRWPEIFEMNSTSAQSTVECLQKVFDRFGYPKSCIMGLKNYPLPWGCQSTSELIMETELAGLSVPSIRKLVGVSTKSNPLMESYIADMPISYALG
uniref:Integrase catalytic domain-containing protein n=1 Tax=Ditylenchus dipsaci TaxID=166011 RepID=A0A915ED24_9BILA